MIASEPDYARALDGSSRVHARMITVETAPSDPIDPWGEGRERFRAELEGASDANTDLELTDYRLGFVGAVPAVYFDAAVSSGHVAMSMVGCAFYARGHRYFVLGVASEADPEYHDLIPVIGQSIATVRVNGIADSSLVGGNGQSTDLDLLRARARRAAIDARQSLLDGDWAKFRGYLPDGMGAFSDRKLEQMRDEIAGMRFELGEAGTMVRDGSRIFTTIPVEVSFEPTGESFAICMQGWQLAWSNDSGSHWKFVEGSHKIRLYAREQLGHRATELEMPDRRSWGVDRGGNRFMEMVEHQGQMRLVDPNELDR